MRTLEKDIVLKGYKIPKKTPIQLCSGIIAKDERYFENPNDFIPERWLKGADQKAYINPFAHLPFGHGPRKCVGQRFAEQEIYICVAKFLKAYRLTIPDGVSGAQFHYLTFATPKSPLSFNLEKRR